VLAYFLGDPENGAAFIDRALVLNPNLAAAWTYSGWVRTFLGQHELALEHFARSIRLSPLDPFMFSAQNGIAFVHFFDGVYDKASSWAKTALQESPNSRAALRIDAASNARAGRLEDAQKAMARLLEID
jgi:tetratricopeptide (TPR) repeat protein